MHPAEKEKAARRIGALFGISARRRRAGKGVTSTGKRRKVSGFLKVEAIGRAGQ